MDPDFNHVVGGFRGAESAGRAVNTMKVVKIFFITLFIGTCAFVLAGKLAACWIVSTVFGGILR